MIRPHTRPGVPLTIRHKKAAGHKKIGEGSTRQKSPETVMLLQHHCRTSCHRLLLPMRIFQNFFENPQRVFHVFIANAFK